MAIIERLTKQDPFFDTLFEHASDGYVVLDEQLRVRYLNATARGWFGDSALVRDTTCGEMVACETELGVSLHSERCFGCRVLQTRSSLPAEQMNIRRSDGSCIPVSVSYSYIPMVDGSTRILMSLRDISLQKKSERERQVNDELRFTLEERERIARDLHDTVAQDLAYAVMEVKKLRRLAEKRPESASPDIVRGLETLSSALEQGVQELRNALYDLNFVLETDFSQFVRDAATQLELHAGVKTHVTVCGTDDPWPQNVEVQLARTVKEALSNIRKHAHATEVWIHVACTREGIVATIRDNGRGIPADRVNPDDHYGLRSIRERCRLLGGEADLQTGPSGTAWRLRIPSPNPPQTGSLQTGSPQTGSPPKTRDTGRASPIRPS